MALNLPKKFMPGRWMIKIMERYHPQEIKDCLSHTVDPLVQNEDRRLHAISGEKDLVNLVMEMPFGPFRCLLTV